MKCGTNVGVIVNFLFMQFFYICTQTNCTLLSCVHLWRATGKNNACKCLTNKAGVLERQTLCVHEGVRPLCSEVLSISRHTTSFNVYHIQTGQEVTHTEVMSACMTSHPKHTHTHTHKLTQALSLFTLRHQWVWIPGTEEPLSTFPLSQFARPPQIKHKLFPPLDPILNSTNISREVVFRAHIHNKMHKHKPLNISLAWTSLNSDHTHSHTHTRDARTRSHTQ